MSNHREARPIKLPDAKPPAYFPTEDTNGILAQEAIRRAGENLVLALAYGSCVTGDATATSIHDMILIVNDTKVFHKKNINLHPDDYGRPHSARWHDYLNRFGLNFYRTEIKTGEQSLQVKYGVISADDFIKGCNGTLKEKEQEGVGAFGFYVAGRMQKAALCPLYRGNKDIEEQLEQAINTARIDGVWFALGLLGDKFSFDELLTTYVSLSYRADLRIEKPGKVQTLIEKSRNDYEAMLCPVLNTFVEYGLVKVTEDGTWNKLQSLSREEVEARLRELKLETALTNYLKNPLTFGIGPGIEYAIKKVTRAIQARRDI